jgi:hypothetical protein
MEKSISFALLKDYIDNMNIDIATPIKMEDGESLEDLARQICRKNGCNMDNDNFIEQMADELYDKYVLIDGIIYEIDKEDLDDDGDISEVVRLSDGRLKFHFRYYNGGTCFSEMLKDGVNNLKVVRKDKLDKFYESN